MELVEAYDAGKLEAYHPGRILPAQSSLRLLQINSLQQGRIHSACREYLTRVALHEAPEGANMVLTELDEEETMEVATEESGVDPIRVPVYKSAEITPKSLDQLQDFMRLCEEEKDKGKLKRRAVEYLKKSGLFERAALVRINVLNDLALVEHAIGLGKRGGDKVEISNPLSPFHTFKTDIRSCNIKSGAFMAPFGVSAYAIGPVELESGERVVLYADQGREGVLSMESRRVFRLALGMLMQSVQAL